MTSSGQTKPQRVVIASANPLFGRGLEKLLKRRWGTDGVEIRMAATLNETMSLMDQWKPDVVVVDYDDRNIHRSEFLSHFVSGDQPMQVMLVSLQASGAVVVYDRRSLTPAQMEDWFTPAQSPPAPEIEPEIKKKDRQAETLIRERKRSGGMRHYLIVSFLVAVMTVLVYMFLLNSNLLPMAASLEAQPIDRLFRAEFLVISFLFSLITMFMLYSLIVPNDTTTSANPKFHEAAMEMIDAIALVTSTEDVIAHL